MADADTPDPSKETPGQPPAGEPQKWYGSLSDDLRSNATVQKYTSLEEQVKGHLELQRTLGHDKVVWPKDEKDTKAWAEVHKRLGVPEKAEAYGLEAVDAPEGLGVKSFDRLKFQDTMKEVNATPAQAKKLWQTYTGLLKESVNGAQERYKQQVETAKADLMKTWGEAYQAKVQRGQAVIDNFAENKEQKDFLTASVSSNPMGMKFLAKLGDLFSEHSVGGFQEKRSFNLTPNEARAELDRIKSGADYHSDNPRVRMPVVERADELMRMIMSGQR